MNRHWRGIASRLALFAMLMVFLGPLIGQGTARAHEAHRHASMSHSPMGDMDCGAMPGRASMGEYHGMAIWEKCGYCSLLFQHPPLLESKLPGQDRGVPALRLAASEPAARRTTAPVFPGARSRAPPLIR